MFPFKLFNFLLDPDSISYFLLCLFIFYEFASDYEINIANEQFYKISCKMCDLKFG